jgi:hypothetical protein
VAVGRDVAFTVVKSIAQNLSVVSNSCEPSHLTSDKEVKWTMEVTKLVLILYCSCSDAHSQYIFNKQPTIKSNHNTCTLLNKGK